MNENRTYNPLDRSARRSYDEWQPEVPEQVWDTLEESILLEQVWDKLESSLHIELVWDKLHHSLTKQQNRYSLLRKSLSLAILLCISFFSSDSLETDNYKPAISSLSGNTKVVHPDILTAENYPHNSQNQGNQGQTMNNTYLTSNANNLPEPIITELENSFDSHSFNGPSEVPELKLLNFNTFIPEYAFRSNQLTSPIEPFSKTEFDNERRLRYGIYFAAQVSRFNWKSSRPINTYHPEAGYEVGLSLLYRFNHFYLGLQAGASLLCQSEKHYINGKYSTVDYDLNTATIRIPVSVPVFHKLELQAAADALIPYQSVGKNESKIVELPRMSGFYPGFSAGINYRVNRFAAINLSYGINYSVGSYSTSIHAIQQVQCQFSVHF